MGKDTFSLKNNRTGEEFEFDILDGTRGPSLLDMRTFLCKKWIFFL